jgi:4-amino-4-deoxy-L-arabinose transferase-like glycosyltransferase
MNKTSRTGSLVPPPGWARDDSTGKVELSSGFLLIATLLGAVLRLYSLTGQSLWVDELLTWQMIRPGVPAGFIEQILDSIQGPLYMAVIWPLVRLQDSALMLRLPAAIAGIATIPLFGLVVSRLLGGRAARLAVLLLALNPFHVWYSQESRGYSLLMMFSVLMALAILALGRRKSGYGLALLFALASAGAVWSNLGGIFLWLGMGLGVLLFHFPANRRQWILWGLAFGAGMLLVSPWLLKASGIWAVDRVLPGSGLGESLRGETTFSPLAWPYTLQTFFYGYSLGPSLRELHQPDRMAVLRTALPVLVLGAVPVGLGLVAGLFRIDRKRGQLIVWIIVPMLILTLLALRNVKPWNPRYLAMVFPWVLAFTAYGLASLPRRAGLAATLLLSCLTLWSLGGYYWNGRYFKADVRAAATQLETSNPEGDPILVPVVTSVFKYYYKGSGEVIDTYGLPVLGGSQDAEEFCDRVLAGRTKCWLVLAREWYFDPGGHLPRALSRRGHLRLETTAAGVRVYGWEKVMPNHEN